MARGNKLSGRKKPPEKSPGDLLKIILEDVVNTATMSFDDWRALSQSPLIQLAIPVSLDRQFRVTQTGVDAAHELTKQMWKSRYDFCQTIDREEFNKLSFQALGETILGSHARVPKLPNDATIFLDEIAFYSALTTDYKDNLDQLTKVARPDVDQHIPCHLFRSDQEVPAFSVGPVQFRPRADWIDHFVADLEEKGYILQVESGELPMDELSRQAFLAGSSRSLFNAWSILNSLRGFSWIATVRMTGHSLVQSHHKASIIVGLSIDVIGLRFQLGDARCFTKAGRQHLFSEERLATSTSGVFIRGSSMQMPGLGSRPGALAAKMMAERAFLDAAGKILQSYIEGRQTGRAPHLVERWANALYWVGEARREASDFMAVVNYGCAADGLSGAGGNSFTMTKFAEAALNPKGHLTPTGFQSIADAVTTVYCEGRNKLAHGEMSGLLEDLTEARTLGDDLLVNLFDVVTLELANIIDVRPQILEVDEKSAYRAFIVRLQSRA